MMSRFGLKVPVLLVLLVTASGAASAQPSAQQSLSGAVQTDTSTIEALKDIRDLCKHVKRVGTDFLYETQRPDFAAVGTPTVIGTTVIPPRPDPSGMVNMGPQAPRKKWLDYYCSQLSALLPRLESEPDAIAVRANQSDIAELVSDMKNEVKNLKDTAAKISELTKQPPFDSYQIGGRATELRTISDRIAKDEKLLEDKFKRDEKTQQKEEKLERKSK